MKSNINLESLESERKINKAILFYKIQNNLVDVTLYLRQAAHFPGKFTLIHCRTTAIRDPLYHTASLWGTHYQWHQPPQSHLKPSRPVHQVAETSIPDRTELFYSTYLTTTFLTLHSTQHNPHTLTMESRSDYSSSWCVQWPADLNLRLHQL